MNQSGNDLYSGTSGLVLPVPNKQSYPPDFQQRSRLCYYSSLFNSIEINSSFYKLPQARTMAKWADDVPDHFRFTFKLWKEITHNKGLVFNPDDVHGFIDVINNVGKKKGCLLVQFPPSLSISSAGELEMLLSELQQADPDLQWKVAVEFRNKSWYQDGIFELLENYNACMVIHDIPASASPIKEQWTDFVYLRFHGPNGGYRGSYPDSFLHEYSHYIREWQGDDKQVYAYFNNTMGAAVHNLITLNEYMGEDLTF